MLNMAGHPGSFCTVQTASRFLPNSTTLALRLRLEPPTAFKGEAVSVLSDARALAGDIADLRHRLHQEPEIGLQLPRTQEKVIEALSGLPY